MGRAMGQVVGIGRNGPTAVEVATNNGNPKSTSISHVAMRCVPPGAPNSNTTSCPSNAVGHSPVNGWLLRTAKSVVLMAASRAAS